MPHITTRGLQLFYETTGAGRPLVFLHGYTATSGLWDAQVPCFSPHYRVIRLDQRGHGRSDGTDQAGYTLQAMASDVMSLLDALSLNQATVIGHSMGGMIAQHLVCHHYERCRGVILSSTTPRAPKREYFEPMVDWAISFGKISSAERAADPMMRNSQPISEATARGCGEMMMNMPGFANKLKGNDMPALVVNGSEESDSILTGSKQLAELMPNAEAITIPGAGHVPQVTHPAEYNRALVGFLNQIWSD